MSGEEKKITINDKNEDSKAELELEAEDQQTDASEPEVVEDIEEKTEEEADDCKSAEVEQTDWQDRCLRVQAELSNATKTIPKRIAEGVGRFKRSHFMSLLELADGFDRAAQHMDKSSKEWQDGFGSLSRILIETMNKAGVEQLNCKGKKFDPSWHEVISTVPNPEMEDGSVLEVVRSGWKMDGKLLRAAMVVVVKND